MSTELTKYVHAFGDEQAHWIEATLYPELTVVDHWFLMTEIVPVRVQNWYGRRHQIAIVRSLISGGHRLTITKSGRVLGYADFLLTDEGWILQETQK